MTDPPVNKEPAVDQAHHQVPRRASSIWSWKWCAGRRAARSGTRGARWATRTGTWPSPTTSRSSSWMTCSSRRPGFECRPRRSRTSSPSPRHERQHRGGSAGACQTDAAPAVKGRGPGRRRRRPDKMHADKGYDNKRCRAYLRRRGDHRSDRPTRRRVQGETRPTSMGGRADRLVDSPVQATRPALRPRPADHERPAHPRLRIHLPQDPQQALPVMKPGLTTSP
jgi:hypothetical protein